MRLCDRPPLRPRPRFLLAACILALLLGTGFAQALGGLAALPGAPVPTLPSPARHGGSAPCDPTGSFAPARYALGFHDMPWALAPGQDFSVEDGPALGRVVRVDAVLRFAVVETVDPGRLERCAPRDGNVRYVEPSGVLRALGAKTGDPHVGRDGTYGPDLVGAPRAWATTRGSADVVACVADTGVRSTHEDLDGPRYLGGFDVLLDRPSAPDDDGHGTHVTGILAASSGNGKGVAGMAQVSFVHAKVLQAGGAGFADVIASGIRWCVEQKADVISLSLGGSSASPLQDAIDYAWAKGALIVAAAGNEEPQDCDESDCVAFPAAYPRALAVGCVDKKARVCLGSSQGPGLDLAAPGLEILSLGHRSDDDYERLSGTSMAAPLVAGAGALLKSARPEWDNFQIRSALERTAQALDEPGSRLRAGRGLLRVDLAMHAAPDDHAPPLPELVLDASQLVARADAAPSRPGDAPLDGFLWEWGDGRTATGPNATHVYASPGSYDVTLTVVDAAGARASATARVEVAGEHAQCSAESVAACAPPVPAPELPQAGVATSQQYRARPVRCSPGPDGQVAMRCDAR